MSRPPRGPYHARADAGALDDRVQEVAAVLGLPCRARRGRHDVVDAVRVGEPLELDERLQRGLHGRRRERAAVEAAGAKPHHLLLAIDHLEGAIRRIRTTIMWTELVPMSIAASFTGWLQRVSVGARATLVTHQVK